MTSEAASRICIEQCRAWCCRGPLFLRLSGPEEDAFRAHADRLGVEVRIRGDGVRFLDHEKERCPMLDPVTSRCRIYEERPARCREFPDRVRVECELSRQPIGER